MIRGKTHFANKDGDLIIRKLLYMTRVLSSKADEH